MIFGFGLLLCVAVADWLAVAKGWRRVEFVLKPATMLLLFALLAWVGRFSSLPLVYFGAGILLSMLGDAFLMVSYRRPSNRWFIAGLISFLLAHVAYIIGFNTPLPNVTSVWSMLISVVLALSAGRVLKRIVMGVREKKLHRMVAPVLAYGLVITLMFLSALLTIYRSDWNGIAAALVCLGAGLFYLSDILLAWNRYVKPIRNGRLLNMVSYHLGQFLLIGGVLIQFVK